MHDQDPSRGWQVPLFGKRKSSSDVRRGRRTLSLESCEPRLLMTGSYIPTQFNIPADVSSKGVYAEVSAQLQQQYTNNQGKVLPSGTYVYYKSSIGDYDSVKPTTTDFVFTLTGTSPSINLPNVYVQSGQIVIGVGSAPIVTYTAQGVSTPTVSTNPTNYYGLFEYSLASNGLDIDLSEVDQISVPFTITTSPAAPTPANNGVGIAQSHANAFSLYPTYLSQQGGTAALFTQALTAGQPYRILAPETVLESSDAPTLNGITQQSYSKGGNLQLGHTYYYWVTATDASGESAPSSSVTVIPYTASIRSHPYNMQTVTLTWNAFAGPSAYAATGYKIYRSQTNDPTTAGLIGSTSASKMYFTDSGGARIGGAPPLSSYTYDPLNAYFNGAIGSFFAHYLPTNSFTIDVDGYTFTGNTNTAYPGTDINGNANTYCALVLTSTQIAGNFVIYQPWFSTNTNLPGAPAPPQGMPNYTQTPAAMVMACDGVFNTASGTISDLQNRVVSAFNRGIATTFSIPPNLWAAEPSLNSATAGNTSGGNLTTPGTYYYVVTATINGSESTVSLERAATIASGDNYVHLAWNASDAPTQYNIYRTQTPGTGYYLVGTQPNAVGSIAFGYDDKNLGTNTPATPPAYYAPGSTSNWYAGFLHTNATNSPATGMSVNGLAYGFAYDDDGGASTNFQANFTNVYINLQSWGTGSLQSPLLSAAALQIISQPNPITSLGGESTISFQVLDSQGAPLLGATSVTVTLLGVESGSYLVRTDPSSGIGTLSVLNSALGYSKFGLRLASGYYTESNPFNVIL